MSTDFAQSMPTFFDDFGENLALSGDTLAVFAFGEDICARGVNGDGGNNSCGAAGAVYVFTQSNGTWLQQAYNKASNTDDTLGSSIALMGDTLAVGSNREASCATGVDGNRSDNSCAFCRLSPLISAVGFCPYTAPTSNHLLFPDRG